MPIVPSPARRIHALVEQLSSPEAARRDRAVARLTLLGAGAVEPVAASIASAPPAGRLAALEVLEALDDPRALAAVAASVADESDAVATRAVERLGSVPSPSCVGALAEALTRGRGAVSRAAAEALARLHRQGIVEALSPLVDVVVDESTDAHRRLLALDLLLALEPPLSRATLRPLARRLSASAVPLVAERGARLTGRDPAAGRRTGSSDPLECLGSTRPSDGDVRRALAAVRRMQPAPLPRLHAILESTGDPRVVSAVAEVLGEIGDKASIPVLARTLSRLATRRGPSTSEEIAARVAIHVALSHLDTRIALHDLRDLVALPPRPAPGALLGAVERVGDASLVPALARAATEDPSLVGPCARAYAAIARRHRLRRTSAALRKVRKEHRPALEAFLVAASQKKSHGREERGRPRAGSPRSRP